MKYLGKETTLTLRGKQYTFSRLSRRILSEFEEWAATKLPNPLDLVLERLHKFPEHLQKHLATEALKEARKSCKFASPEVQELLKGSDGMAKLVQLLLRQHHPEITEEEAFNLAMEVGDESDFLAVNESL